MVLGGARSDSAPAHYRGSKKQQRPSGRFGNARHGVGDSGRQTVLCVLLLRFQDHRAADWRDELVSGGEFSGVLGAMNGGQTRGLVFRPEAFDVSADLRAFGGNIGHAIADIW